MCFYFTLIILLKIVKMIDLDYIRDRVKREKDSKRDKARYKHNFNKARNKGKKKNEINVNDCV